MTEQGPSQIVAVIFCGGAGVRMGPLARIQTKTLLPAFDKPLLWRLIEQLQITGFSRIVVSTTPRYELQIAQAVELHAQSRAQPVPQVVGSIPQETGVLPGFQDFLDSTPTERALFCLGDIFFLSNPFASMRTHLAADYDCLAAVKPTVPQEVDQGGLILHDRERLLSVIEGSTVDVRQDPWRWSGLALVSRRRALVDIGAFLQQAPADSPPGELFEFQRRRGAPSRVVVCPDFVNINTPDHLLLASIYARMEALPESSSARMSLGRAADSLRRQLAGRSGSARAAADSVLEGR